MIYKMIEINAEKCNGCELCIEVCHKGAIEIVNGKAQLLHDSNCDGHGACLPACPVDAITFSEREAAAYSKNAENIEQPDSEAGAAEKHSPDLQTSGVQPDTTLEDMRMQPDYAPSSVKTQLRQWPIQLTITPINAPYFDGAHLLIAADCAAYAYGDFHNAFIKNKITLIFCPKLNDIDYAEKLTEEIIRHNNLKSITVARMEVPCCQALENAIKKALKNSGKMIPWQISTISTDGQILD